jgi:hypothetical protein
MKMSDRNTIDREAVEELEQKIFEACHETGDLDVILAALKSALVFHMGCLCPNCRRNVAQHLKEVLPAMEKAAGEFAAFETEHGGGNWGCH